MTHWWKIVLRTWVRLALKVSLITRKHAGGLRPDKALINLQIFSWCGSVGLTVKPVLSGNSKIDKTKISPKNGSLMKVESIAECSPWSILQYFWPALSANWDWKPFLVFLRVTVLDRFYCTLDSVNVPNFYYCLAQIYMYFEVSQDWFCAVIISKA